LLRIRDFRLILTAYGTTHLGDDLAIVALTIRVQELTGSGLAVSALLIAELLPRLLFAPLGGLIIDRLETVRVLVVASIIQAGLAASLAFVEAMPGLLVLSFLLGTAAAVTNPALFALVPLAAGEERVPEANARLELARYAGGAVGPLLAGVLSARLGTRFALLVDAGTFLVIAGCAAALRLRRAAAPLGEDEAPPRAREGIAFIRGDPVLQLTFVVLALSVVFAAIDNVAEVFFAKDVLGAGDTGYGILVGSWTLGMVVAATVIARRVPALRLALSVLLAAVVGGSAIAFAAALPSVPLAVAMWFIGGGANGMENVGLRSLIHHRVPERIQGRVFAAYYAVINGASIGATVLGGALVAVAGARGSLLTAGLGGLAAGLIGLLWYTRLRAREPTLLVSGPPGPAEGGLPEAAPGS
jgi:MFS family permease